MPKTAGVGCVAREKLKEKERRPWKKLRDKLLSPELLAPSNGFGLPSAAWRHVRYRPSRRRARAARPSREVMR